MSNSKLVDYTRISPHRTSPRTHKIDKITIHHMAGNLSVETCGNVFQSREASSNYGIGSDGRVGMYVEEQDRSWASSNRANDHRAVTIEVANSAVGGNWPVSDTALAKLIDLCVDICQRNGIEKLNFTGDETGNLTMHKYFVATTCPGPYLESKFSYIAQEVNKRLAGTEEPALEPLPEPVDYTLGFSYLRKGDQGEAVRALQLLLIGRGFSCGRWGADGDFGAGTEEAVKAAQEKAGKTKDGVAGPDTMGYLLGLTGGSA